MVVNSLDDDRAPNTTHRTHTVVGQGMGVGGQLGLAMRVANSRQVHVHRQEAAEGVRTDNDDDYTERNT